MGAIRFSLSRFTTEAEIETTLQILPEIIGKLREMSPLVN
jgi:cysteine desulfurase